jgi:pyroglutamyl-peptidase
MTLTILLTGFGPFPGAPSNPTAALVAQLARLRRPALSEVRLLPHVFQTSYRAVDRDLPRLLAEIKPDAVLMFGLSGKASCLRVEMRARNALSTLVRDAERQQPSFTRILPGGPEALAFDIPAARLVLAARGARVQAVASRDAGRYLCNYLSWRAIEAAGRPAGPNFAAFIHVPRTRPGGRWTMRDLLRGGEAILLAALMETRKRRRMTGR